LPNIGESGGCRETFGQEKIVLSGLILILVIVGAFLIVPIAISIFFFQRRKKCRRSPLTSQLLRTPGETLRGQIESTSEKIDDYFFKILVAAAIAVVLPATLTSLGNGKVFIWQLWLLGACYVLTMILLSVGLYRLMRNRQDLYLGLDAELAVGQELNQLMLKGCYVFHDFPAEEFNIDHVVIGREGVFAVETKGRPKPDKGRGAQDARVTFDGNSLQFPGWSESGPLNQAKRQAVWLSKWLTSAVGEPVRAQPVLALPGWFVDLRARTEYLVFNGKNPQLILRTQKGEPLNDSQLQRIVHQVEQRCRNVAPAAYSRKEKHLHKVQ
jgi:hypothetical protein